jgi:hypothetical protein
MALFRHPSLVRGIVHTPHGAFNINRRIVDVSEEIGESLGWEPVETSMRPDSAARELLASVARMNQADAN